ncbi:conserved membrane protein of unknown function [Petrocella atlantisensis]|uniref:DUF1468 domain-containing protein n=1 Tax=Petrocella atlantisensis TaxID=2173034 RepID=A0A3P7S238_9FIRM|nr:tripartite tricarboxylate transporter TctB family protein [Petrocella atlantisensis]VDN48906.1 conserved membrane protein of unknown function [Petrocella atlantisensis]
MEKRNLRRADLVTSIIVFAFSVFVFISAIGLMSNTLEKGKEWYVSAGLFPIIISVFLALCAFMLFFRAKKDGARFDFIHKEAVMALLKDREFRVAVIIISLLIIYIFILLPLLPYWLATFIFLYTFMLIFQERTFKNIVIMTIVAVLSTVALTYGFGTLAMIPLP